MTESYRTVTTIFRGFAPSGKAIFVDSPNVRGGGQISIALSLIHDDDKPNLHALFICQEAVFRLVEWKAEEVGWA